MLLSILLVVDVILAAINFYVYKLTARRVHLFMGVLMSGLGIYNLVQLTM
jgi:hypothetical protein